MKVFGASAGRQENPKAENRKPKESRSSKSEKAACTYSVDAIFAAGAAMRRLISVFGFRICQPDSVEGGHGFGISRAFLPRPRDRRH